MGRLSGFFSKAWARNAWKPADHAISSARRGGGERGISFMAFVGSSPNRGGFVSASSMPVMPSDQMSTCATAVSSLWVFFFPFTCSLDVPCSSRAGR